MSTNDAIFGLSWDFAAVRSVDQSQRWVLSAMQEHGPGLVTMLWRILGNEQDLCDAYQQTFLQLAHYEDRQKPDNVGAYLFRTATNTAISMLRQKKVRLKYKKSFEGAKTTQTFNYGSDLDAKHLQQKLRSAITRLPEYLRDVIVLRDLAELPYERVSRILGIKAGTARVYRSKAITLLASWLNKEESRGNND